MAIQDFKVKNGLVAAGNASFQGGTLTVGAAAVAALIQSIDVNQPVGLFNTSAGTINVGTSGSTLAAQAITTNTSTIRGVSLSAIVGLFDTSTGTINVGASASTLAAATITTSASTIRSTVPAANPNLFDTTTGTINVGGSGSTVAAQTVTSATSSIRGTTPATTVNLFDTSTGTVNIGGAGSNVIVKNLTVQGTTTTVNSASLTVSDNVVHLGSVSPQSGITGTAATNKITGMSTTSSMIAGQIVTVTAGTPTLPGGTTIVSVDSASQVTLSNSFTGSGAVTVTVAGATDATANSGGMALTGTTTKTILWDATNTNWTSSEFFNLASGKTYKINNSVVLSATQVLGRTPGGTSAGDIDTIDGVQTLSNKTIAAATISGTQTGSGSPTYTGMGSWSGTSGTFSSSLSAASLSAGAGAISGGSAAITNGITAASLTAANVYGQVATGGSVIVRANSTDSTGTISLNSATIDSTAVTNIFPSPASVTAYNGSTTLTIGGTSATQTINIGPNSTGASTYNFGTGSVASATKTINIGTNIGASGVSNVNIGASSGTTTINGTAQLPTGATKVGNTTLVQGGAYTITFPAGTGTLALNNQTFYIGSTAVTINQGTGTVTLPNSALTNNTISGVALGGTLAALTLGTGLTGSSYNGSGAVSVTVSGLTNSHLSGTAGITNANLQYSSVTIGSTAVSLGSAVTSLGGLSTVTATTFSGNATSASLATEVSAAFGRTDTTAYPIAWISNNGSKSQLYSATAVTITSSTGTITASAFVGNGAGLTGSSSSFSAVANDVYAWAKAATKPSYTAAEVGLGNVNNTADSVKSVNYANTAGGAPASDVYTWAKAATKPSYTASEVGLGSVNNTADASKSVLYAATAGGAPASDVYTWAKQASKPTYTASEVGLGNVSNTNWISNTARVAFDYNLAGRTNGSYACEGAGTNGPGAAYLNLIHQVGSTDVGFQIAGGYTSDNMYFRGSSAVQTGSGYTPWRTVIHSGNIGSQSVNYAGTAGSAPANGGNSASVGGQVFTYSNSSNTPTYIWATDTNGTNYLAARGSLSVNYATTAGNITAYTINQNVGSGNSPAFTGLNINPGAGASASVQWYSNSGVIRGYSYVDSSGVGFLNNSGGWSARLNYGTNDWYVVGNVTAYSDERVKTNWRNFNPTFIQDLANVKSGIYDRTDMTLTQVGVSAQSLQKVMPDAVIEDTNGNLSVAYGNAAMAAVIELAKEIVNLKAIIAELQASK